MHWLQAIWVVHTYTCIGYTCTVMVVLPTRFSDKSLQGTLWESLSCCWCLVGSLRIPPRTSAYEPEAELLTQLHLN